MYKLKQGIKNLFKYFKVIWNDRDWDFEYIYDLFEVKLTSMHKYFSSRDRIAEASEKDADNILYALSLLKSIKDIKGIQNEAFYKFRILYPDFELDMKFIESDNPKLKRIIWNFESDSQKALWNKCSKLQYEIEKRKHNEFWTFMRDHIRYWWD